MKKLPELQSEFVFKAVRSGGKGGQNVNKVSTKVELYFDIRNSQILAEEQKSLLLEKCKSFISNDGLLRLTSDVSRSQFKNKADVISKFEDLIRKAFTPKKKRKNTSVPKSAKENRSKQKKKNSEKKNQRKKPFID